MSAGIQPGAADRQRIINMARVIQGEIIAAGGMATKSSVEDVLMSLYRIDRGEAHDVMNTIEFYNRKPIDLFDLIVREHRQ